MRFLVVKIFCLLNYTAFLWSSIVIFLFSCTTKTHENSSSVTNNAGNDTTRQMLIKRIEKQIYSGQFDSAEKLINKTESLFLDTTRFHTVKFFNQKALLYYYLGKFDFSLSLLYQSKRLNERYIKSNHLKHEALLFIGGNYYALKKMDSALYYFTQIEQDKQFNDEANRVNVVINIGAIYDYLKDYEKAINYYKKAEQMVLNKSPYHLARIYNNIGAAYVEEDSLDKAIAYLEKSVETSKQNQFNDFISSPLSNLGLIYEKKKNYIKALEFFKQALHYDTLYGYEYDIVNTYNQLGRIYFLNNQPDLSIYFLNLAYKTNNNFPFLKTETLLWLSRAYEKNGNSTKAIILLNEFISLNDSLNQEELVSKTKQIEQQYAVWNVEKELQETQANVNQKNRYILFISLLLVWVVILSALLLVLILKKQKAAREALKQKMNHAIIELNQKLFASQIDHHFISNVLNAIQLTFVQGNTIQASAYMSKFSLLLRKLIGSSLEKVEKLSETIEFLQLYTDLELLRFDQKFTIHIETTDEVDEESILIPPLIVQPFVENAIHHAFKGVDYMGKIHVLFDVLPGNKLKIVITDNGVGINQDVSVQKDRKSYGAKLSMERIRLWGEELKQETKVTINPLYPEKTEFCGTVVEITIPYLI